MFDVCTTSDTAQIDTIFKFLPQRVNTGASIFFIGAMIRASRSARSRGNVGTYQPCDIADLKARFIAIVKNIDAPVLTRECCIDVCRFTVGAHIEHL
jgi:hypothetical protein